LEEEHWREIGLGHLSEVIPFTVNCNQEISRCIN